MSNSLVLTAPEGSPFMEFEREFDAPVAALFNAHRDPELFKQWIGPNGYEVALVEYDFRTGGSYRYAHRNGSEEYVFHGVFHSVRENEFAVQTFEYEGAPDQVSMDFLTFVDLGDGRSKLQGRSVMPSIEARNFMVESGMETGMEEGYARLDQLVAKSS